MYVLQRTTDGKFVARPGSAHSYVKELQLAQAFSTKEEADRARCPESERIVRVEDLMGQRF
jgi:hypothetical protein